MYDNPVYMYNAENSLVKVKGYFILIHNYTHGMRNVFQL